MNTTRAKALVIVESPTKAKTIRKFLGDQYIVEASMGHVRDLPSSATEIPTKYKQEPWARIGVNVEDLFQPLYIIPADKKARIKELKAHLKEVEELYIATDEDREGESIGWHLIEVLNPKVPVKRMVFHEITEKAIMDAIAHPRTLDHSLVQAQETRRVLDRLVGYVVSPQLWKKVASKLSAGRVQSAAVKLLVERERERMRFYSGEWWNLVADICDENAANSDTQNEEHGVAAGVFSAHLLSVDGTEIAQSSHFDSSNGQVNELYRDKVSLLDQEKSDTLVALLMANPHLIVDTVERRESKKRPLPPFITSTLQQAANRRLGWGTSVTMRVAQRLYENGYITYMRTDAPALAQEAIEGIRAAVERQYGKSFLPSTANVYRAKDKNAQEAHEAIRPAGTEMKTAQQLGLSGQEEKLYTLIWRRTMACQMNPAELSYTTVKLRSEGSPNLLFRGSGRELIQAGFMLAYEVKDEDESQLPALTEGQRLKVNHVRAQEHHTKAPARYSEASLVKSLEQEGVGRPSTYASIIDTIQKRGYVFQNGRQLAPTFTGFAVTQLLEQAFSQVVDPEFTASMERWLDEITMGGDGIELLKSFYQDQLMGGVTQSEALDPREVCAVRGVHFPTYEVRVGRFGPFIEYEADGTKTTLSLPSDICPDMVTSEWIEERISQAQSGEVPIGVHPVHQEPIFMREGRFGTYLQLGDGDKPKRSSLPKGLQPEQLTLDQAAMLLDLPKQLGTHPETDEPIIVNLGRYGAYAQHQKIYASLPNDLALFTLDLEGALTLIKEKESGARGASKAQTVLRELGEHPDGGAINLYEGRYGPYVKHGKINASLPKNCDVESFTIEQAIELISKKSTAKTGTAKKSTTKKSTAKTSTAKTGTAKTGTAKKSTAKTSTAKKSTAKK